MIIWKTEVAKQNVTPYIYTVLSTKLSELNEESLILSNTGG